MRHVFEAMGTVVSLESGAAGDVPPDVPADIPADIPAIFARWEIRFSLYLPGSELSRIARAELTLMNASDELRAVYADALEWRERTHGAFSPHRPDGVIDLNGIVKAATTKEAGEALLAAGCRDWSINVGGDILVSGAQPDGDPWSIGVTDPRERGVLLTAIRLSGSRRAVATSGAAERGDHIWRGGSTAPTEFTQVTVVADDIVTADVLATAIVAGGSESLDYLTERFDIDALTVNRTGELRSTPGFRSSLAA